MTGTQNINSTGGGQTKVQYQNNNIRLSQDRQYKMFKLNKIKNNLKLSQNVKL